MTKLVSIHSKSVAELRDGASGPHSRPTRRLPDTCPARLERVLAPSAAPPCPCSLDASSCSVLRGSAQTSLQCRSGPGLRFGELNPLSLRPVTRLNTACGLCCRLACFPGTRSLGCFSMSPRTGWEGGRAVSRPDPHPVRLTSSEAGVCSVAHDAIHRSYWVNDVSLEGAFPMSALITCRCGSGPGPVIYSESISFVPTSCSCYEDCPEQREAKQ